MTREEAWDILVSLGAVSGKMPSGPWDLRGVNLRGVNLREANLRGANLSGADFREADLSGANLNRANLSEADLREAIIRVANLSEADLVRADLSEADLSEADLSEADLSEADLSKADLSEANLSEADLIGSDFHGANLSEANLSGADLSEATLINTNLTKAVLNGACIDNANLSEWIIKDIVCTHLIEGKGFAERKIQFDLYEFEKKYTYIPKIVEMILNIPFTESASLIGKFIVQSINYCEKSSVIGLKGVEAIAGYDTKFTFIVHDDGFFETKRDKIQTIKGALNEYFKEKPLEKGKEVFWDPLEDETNGLISTRESIPIPYTPYQINPKVVRERAIEFYIKMGKLGEAIHNIICKTFR